jgi:hypothetical protein
VPSAFVQPDETVVTTEASRDLVAYLESLKQVPLKRRAAGK